MTRYKITAYIEDKDILNKVLFLAYLNGDTRNKTVSKIVIQSIIDNEEKINEALSKFAKSNNISVDELKEIILNKKDLNPNNGNEKYPNVFDI